MRDRLESDPADAIQRYMYGPRIFGDLERDFAAIQQVNRAHVVMLAETRIIARDAAAALLRALDDLDRDGAAALPISTALEDLHLNLETELVRRLGPEIGGQVHTARSRNDLYATTHRLKARAGLLRVGGMLISLRRAVLDLAGQHTETVMTGYTHMQAAQPVTFGHYLSAIADGLARDAGRLLDAWKRIDLCPLGAGALATTGFPLDRARSAALLGFAAVLENSIDCVAARDFVPEMLLGFCSIATTLSRLHHDLQLWTTAEFGFLELRDRVAGVSSMMPQKKNPAAIEQSRPKAAHILAALVSCVGSLAATAYSNSRQGSECLHLVKDAAFETESVLALTEVVLGGLVVNQAHMAAAAGRNFSTFTELADTLVRDGGMPFRAAHAMTGELTRLALLRGITGADGVEPSLVREVAAHAMPGAALPNDDVIRQALDPREGVRRRRITGGPAAEETGRMITRARSDVDRDEAAFAALQQQLDSANRQLTDAVAVITEGSRA